MIKKILFLILIYYQFGALAFTNAEIIPVKKPLQTKEETEKKLLIDVLKPLPKPIDKVEEKKVEKKIIVKKEKKK